MSNVGRPPGGLPGPLKAVGKIQEAHGLKGELFVHLFAKQADWLPDLKEVSVGPNPETPSTIHRVARAKLHSKGLILQLEGFADRTQAETLLKQFVFIEEALLVSRKGQPIYLREILGFTVSEQGHDIGVIEAFSSNGPQDLLVVRKNASRTIVEIPFVDAFLIEIDFQAKKVLMQLPAGLIDEES